MSGSANMKLGFLGCGMMARALAGGLIDAGVVEAGNILGSDKFAPAREALEKLGCRSTEDNSKIFAESDVVVVAVKPNDVATVLAAANFGKLNAIVVSIAAGVTISTLEGLLPAESKVVRVMPNTPCLVKEVAAAAAKGTYCSDSDLELALGLFKAVGTAVAVDESKLDAVTGLSGSGPAYGFVIIEALADGGVRMGLPRDQALKLAAQTVLGAAKMVLETGQHPGVLKDQVCSPGGTTIAGVHQLEIGGLRSTLMNAVQAATTRATELGKQ